ncbi:flagellar basal body rod protein FlgB [Salinisphaera sp. P385]|uniref:Flagellar basal body rod protein FlgB n=1 Tax=Spectribacter acetivorans TaxID=3075603 RepID=A0ABU3B7L7_9GAMM|nr:flagellar basal body rod protein FlgB [Salinisphaera sp. P385]MDT0618224.1 flagellar basal body rod protein FlgB [Salinisphaera sp. P385]
MTQPIGAASDAIYGIHADALRVNRDRLSVLAANLANADTPNYKARDIDFRQVLAGVSHGGLTMARSAGSHLSGTGAAAAGVVYRQPLQPSADGNTVDASQEQARFAEAATRYRASLDFANGRIQSLMLAITGGR